MTQSSLRHDGRRPCNRWPNCSAQPVAHSTSTTAKTRPRRCRCRWGTRRIPSAGRATRPMLQTRTSDPTFKNATSFIRAGWTSALEHDLSTEEERRTLPFFQETARPEKREWFAASFFSVEAATGACRSSAETTRLRPKTRHASPGSDPTSAKSSVWPRKFAAFDVASKLSALERVSSAAVVIDATGRATQMNLPAQNLLGADFNLVRGRPAAHDPASNRRLQQLVSSALHAAPGGAQAYAPIVVDRDEAPWLLVEAMPVTAFGSDLFSSGRVILLLTDLRSPLRPEATQLCAAFGLTAAEAKLAAKLASGVRDRCGGGFTGGEPRDCPHPVESSVCQNEHPPPS